jgi:hypothetical protein
LGFWVLGEREDKKKQGENASSSPVLYASRRKRRLMVPFKTAPFALLFLLFFFVVKCMKRRRFDQNALFHLNENWCQNGSNFKSALQFARFFTMVLGFGFLQSSP